MKFDHRIAVVTGAAGRIGRSLAEKLCAEGVAVALADLAADKAETVAATLREKGGNARAYALDVQASESVKAMAEQVLADFGRVDILVNNAGVWLPSLLSETSEEQWLRMIDINLNGTFRVTRAFLPSMLKNGYGRIIQLGSIAGEVGLPCYAGYSAAKAGVIMLTKVMAMELAKKNITVNCVSPGMIGESIKSTPYTWIGRTGLGEEVADLLLFLSSDDASFITGVDYTIDGGRILGPHGNDL